MKNKQNGFIVPLLIFVIVALVVGGGVYINSQKNSQTNNTENQNTQNGNSEPVVPTNTSSVNSTNNLNTVSLGQNINLKTYNNVRYSYTIKYPSDWNVDTTNSEKNFSQRGPVENNDFIGGDTRFYNNSFTVSLMVYKDSNMNYDQFISSKHFEYTTKENLDINGIKSVRLSGLSTDHPVGVSVVNTLIYVGDKMFIFNYSGKPIVQQEKDTADSIINSFITSTKI